MGRGKQQVNSILYGPTEVLYPRATPKWFFALDSVIETLSDGTEEYYQGDELVGAVIPAGVTYSFYNSYTENTAEIEGEAVIYLQGDRLHRLDGPAVITPEYEEWYEGGVVHRLDGPAWTHSNGSQHWYQAGHLHRLGDMPAVIDADGNQEWHVEGELHRKDGPAVIKTDGTEEYWQLGELHRQDGPAVIKADGTKEYWLEDEQYSFEEWAKLKDRP